MESGFVEDENGGANAPHVPVVAAKNTRNAAWGKSFHGWKITTIKSALYTAEGSMLRKPIAGKQERPL